MVVIIWKWPLVQTIMDGYSLKQLFVSYNESNIPTIDEEGEIGVRKKQYTFQKRKQSVRNFDRSMLEILIAQCQGLKSCFPRSLFGM